MKNAKKKKPLNKWKLTAIISLVINGIIALLLVVGLATPKTYAKTNALGQYGDYYIYENSNDINPFENEWGDYYNAQYTGVRYDKTNVQQFSISFYCSGGSSYLEEHTINRMELDFKPHSYNGVTNWYLNKIYFYPMSTPAYWYQVYTASFNNDSMEYTASYQPLGVNSKYVFIPNVLDSNFYSRLDTLFHNLGTNEVIKDYQIEDNFNPNKYISIATASNGLLYDSPTNYFNQVSGVNWSFPIYRGKTTTSDPYDCSTLGWLEVPLLFMSGGENFVGIRFYFDVIQQYIDKDNQVQTLSYGSSEVLHNYYYSFVYMSYCYQLSTQQGTALTSWREKVVTAVPVQQIYVDYTNTSGVNYRNFVYMPFQSLKWLNESYKTIGVYHASTEQLAKVGINENVSRSRWAINQYTIEEILNYDMTQNASGINTGNNIGNVFILIKQAFDSLSGILSLAILPGISIGLLLFLPLVLTIIIVVIKLVKR